jgi:hypothetical protein
MSACSESKGLVLSLCDRTGAMVKPWLDGGYHAVTVDLQEAINPHPNRTHIIADVTTFAPPLKLGRPVAAFAAPPCTHLAVSGAAWMQKKGPTVGWRALAVVDACRLICEQSGAPWCLENPVGIIPTHWRAHDYMFDPCDYGDAYNKRTCLWVGGGFVMPPIVRPGDMFEQSTWVEPTMKNHIANMSPGADRGDRRSVTPAGFAQAVYRANAPHLLGADKQEDKVTDDWEGDVMMQALAGRRPTSLAAILDVCAAVAAEATRRGEHALATRNEALANKLRSKYTS